MKKLVAMILAVVMALACTVVLADEVPQPEAGKKFEGNWAIRTGIVEINYEEEGYRVMINLYNKEELSGEIWEYSCYYVAEKDVLESISSMNYAYTLDPETFDMTAGENKYEGFDEEGQTTVFAITEDGKLTWADGHGNAGADLEFQPIGNFDGTWENKEEEVYVEISWEGMNDEETFFYTVYIRRGVDDHTVEFNMQGLYNWETGKLEAAGTATSFTANAEGGFDPVEDPETYDAFFSMQENGKLLFEAANGIELEYVGHVVNNG